MQVRRGLLKRTSQQDCNTSCFFFSVLSEGGEKREGVQIA